MGRPRREDKEMELVMLKKQRNMHVEFL
jgi:hypothetical protein